LLDRVCLFDISARLAAADAGNAKAKTASPLLARYRVGKKRTRRKNRSPNGRAEKYLLKNVHGKYLQKYLQKDRLLV
jgi:hypothetical protein